MSIIVSGITLPFECGDGEAAAEARRRVGLTEGAVRSSNIYKISFDLRRGGLSRVYSVELETDTDEAELVDKLGLPSVKLRVPSAMPRVVGTLPLEHRPVVIGFGPAGIFAALVLAKNGYRPLILEKGADIDGRDKAVDAFFHGEALDESVNVQFGEGGAGAYSDGKLTTRINDPRCRLVLELLGEYGAPREILTRAKPHIGTDKLKSVVKAIREDIIKMGGEVRFKTEARDFHTENGALKAVVTPDGSIPARTAVLAAGHSASGLFTALFSKGVSMEAKAFSVGVRVEHLQQDIDLALYGRYAGIEGLPVGEYALSHRGRDGRGCYTFCMCPGGYVVAAASEHSGIVTNGMSYHARSGRNANSAVCVSVLPGDIGGGVLDGMRFQQELERRAFEAVGGHDTGCVQLYGDFVSGRISKSLGRVEPTYPRGYAFTDVSAILPRFISEGIMGAMPAFGKKLKGFDSADTVLTAPETRTSSPVRIVRNEGLMSPDIYGLIPCGEGAGYAGGIMSAAVDGIRAAERIMELYAPTGGEA